MARFHLVLPILLSVKPRGVFATYSTLSLTDDVALEDVLADIPLFSVGFVAFGVFTFFFVMRRINRITLYIHLAILLAFLASVFDLSQIIRRGSYNTSHNLQISSVQVLIVLRELNFALSFGLRFFFFWAYVAEPPRGELPLIPVPDDRRANFISLDSDSILHSASWIKWSFVGFFLKWTLLLMTLSVPVLQGLWRLVNAFDKFGPIYYVEGGIEIVLSAIFIMKLFANTFMSPLVPRWKTLRDYIPPMMALLIGMGVGIGNILCFQFSETILGRFLQAIELYILVLFVLISAFYKMPVRSSVVAELVRRRLAAQTGYSNMEDIGRRNSLTMTQNPMAVDGDLRDGSRRSGQSVGRPSLVQRLSSASFFPSRLMSRRNSTRTGSGERRQNNDGEEGDQRRLWNQGEAELGNSPTDQKTTRGSMEQTPTQTPMTEARETPGWRDPMFTSVVREDPLRRLPSAVLPTTSAVRTVDDKPRQPPQIIRSPASPSNNMSQTEMAEFNDIVIVPPPRSTTDSPIYGLDGIIRNLQVGGIDGSRESNVTTERSSGIESLLRQQQELDMSIAGLRSFSPISDTELGPPRVLSESLQSEFSLSNFPEPPFLRRSLDSNKTTTPISARAALPDNSDQSLPITETDRTKSLVSEYSLMVDEVPFQLVQPRMPATSNYLTSQNQPVSLVFSDTNDSILGLSIGEASRGPRFDSQGTQYDVTSFIRGFSTPGKERNSEDTRLADISEGKSMESDADSVTPATISALKRVQLVDGRRPLGGSEAGQAGSSTEQSSSTPASVMETAPLPPPAAAPSEPQPQIQRLPLNPTFTLTKGRGLPTGPRGRLAISKPIPQPGGVLNERTTFERPRPAPLILKDVRDNLSIPTDAVQGDRF